MFKRLLALISTKSKTSKNDARRLDGNSQLNPRAKIIQYANYNEDMPIKCPICGWKGTPKSSEYIEHHADLLDVTCPECGKMLLIVEYPRA